MTTTPDNTPDPAAPREALADAFKALEASHEELRTKFLFQTGELERANDKIAAFEAAEAKRAAAAVDAEVDEAVKAGKVTPATKPRFQELAHKYGLEAFRAMVENMPILGGTLEDAARLRPRTDGVTIDAEIKAALAKAGLTEEDYQNAHAAGLL